MCLYQRACCIAPRVPILRRVSWCRWWQRRILGKYQSHWAFEVPFCQLVYSRGPSNCETALVLSAPAWIGVKWRVLRMGMFLPIKILGKKVNPKAQKCSI